MCSTIYHNNYDMLYVYFSVIVLAVSIIVETYSCFTISYSSKPLFIFGLVLLGIGSCICGFDCVFRRRLCGVSFYSTIFLLAPSFFLLVLNKYYFDISYEYAIFRLAQIPFILGEITVTLGRQYAEDGRPNHVTPGETYDTCSSRVITSVGACLYAGLAIGSYFIITIYLPIFVPGSSYYLEEDIKHYTNVTIFSVVLANISLVIFFLPRWLYHKNGTWSSFYAFITPFFFHAVIGSFPFLVICSTMFYLFSFALIDSTPQAPTTHKVNTAKTKPRNEYFDRINLITKTGPIKNCSDCVLWNSCYPKRRSHCCKDHLCCDNQEDTTWTIYDENCSSPIYGCCQCANTNSRCWNNFVRYCCQFRCFACYNYCICPCGCCDICHILWARCFLPLDEDAFQEY